MFGRLHLLRDEDRRPGVEALERVLDLMIEEIQSLKVNAEKLLYKLIDTWVPEDYTGDRNLREAMEQIVEIADYAAGVSTPKV